MIGKGGQRISRPALAAVLAGAVFLSVRIPIPACPERSGRAADWRSPSAEMNFGTAIVTEKGFGRGLRLGGGVLLKTGHRSGIEILFDKFAVPMSEGAAGLEAGRMEMRSLLFNGHLFFPNRSPVLPYAIVGVGFCFLDYSPDAPAPAEEKDFVDRFALQLGGGLDIRLWARMAVTGKVRYNMVKTWVEERPRTAPIRETDARTQDIYHLYGLNLSLGLKYSF